ncbi:hypothetical protein FHS21_005999 [Phyllobacterium trifolii]|uniref:Uncharacterized protein n=1 Tax=Phyllobacterium trifolii TaxID=300193 RepID=A0A839UI01_9HYPH|nr:hypothetical protein [Phyllobacterium trifolii]
MKRVAHPGPERSGKVAHGHPFESIKIMGRVLETDISNVII